MAKRVMFVVCFLVMGLFILATGVSYAENINQAIPCENGGQMVVTGTYNPVTGAFSLAFNLSNCKTGSTTSNGTLSSSGTFLLTSSTSANVAVNVSSQLTRTGDGGTANTENCTYGLAGTYNLSTYMYNGNVSTNCTGNGSFSLSLTDLLMGTY